MFKFLKGKTNLKIVGATMTIVFSLAAAFSGTIAWFNTSKSQAIDAGSFQVVNNSVSISSLTLCKFNYYGEGQFIDYLHPEKGNVSTYEFNSTTGHFEDDEGNVQEMNMFDPVEYTLSSSLRNLYCNAVYIVTISGSSPSMELEVFANYIEKQKTSNTDIFLSDCADFNVYTQEELDAITTRVYYPSHIINPQSVDLTGYEEIFYKIDYLASTQNHAHFYNDDPEDLDYEKPEQIAIHNPLSPKTVYFTNNTTTFYINVNYSPAQLASYAAGLIEGSRKAIYDYYFAIDM